MVHILMVAFAEETAKRVCRIRQNEQIIVWWITHANGSDVGMRISLWMMKSSKHKSESEIQEARKGCFSSTESAACLEFQVHKHELSFLVAIEDKSCMCLPWKLIS